MSADLAKIISSYGWGAGISVLIVSIIGWLFKQSFSSSAEALAHAVRDLDTVRKALREELNLEIAQKNSLIEELRQCREGRKKQATRIRELEESLGRLKRQMQEFMQNESE